MKRRSTLPAVVALLLAPGGAAGWAHAQTTIPPGFEDVAVVDVPAPTAVAFTPDGRMLITSQPGQLFVVQNGSLVATPALDLAAAMCTENERGLLGVAVDPQRAQQKPRRVRLPRALRLAIAPD